MELSARDALTPREKAAVLMITLGKNYAAKLYQYLTDEEIEQLTLSITSVRRVEPEVKEEVIAEFYEICMAQKFISEGGIDYAKEILDKAFGSERASDLIARLSSALRVRPFDFVRRAESSQVFNFLQNEHPQTIALILSYLEPDQAAVVLASLSLEKQTSVIARIANMGATSAEYVKEAERVLEQKFSSMSMGNQTLVGGVDSLVEILNCVDRGTERHLLESLEQTDAELAEEIKNRMFVFEDMIKLGNQAIQRVLREIDNRDLAVALKGAGAEGEVAKIIFSNVSKRLQEMIKEDIEFMGPIRVRDVEEAQQKIVNVIRRLDEAGEIIISRKSEDELIV
ncbi:MAG: flagellar motor switch protein FliG [Clostridiales bacterium]|jgi:flagellar motor switch protein FliG|nr:flagellar motor switch protein FliG [Clostridiales bacterium]